MCKKKSASIVIWKIHKKPFQPLLSLPSKRAVIQKILQKLQTINFKYGVSPGKWFISDAGEFDTARPRAASECCMEVMAQVRANGRVMEHWRIATRGTALLKVSIDLATIIPALGELPKCTLLYEMWPADLGIRRNMTTSPWQDISALLLANELTVTDEGGQPVENQTIIKKIKHCPPGPLTLRALDGQCASARRADWRYSCSVCLLQLPHWVPNRSSKGNLNLKIKK